MRPYRAIPIGGKDFVYGWYLHRHESDWDGHDKYIHQIHTKEWNEFIEVIPETVGQSTGLKDKNGKEVYAGDTLKNPKDPRGNQLFDVAWSEMFHGWIGNSQTECLQMKPCMFNESEIIGNVHQTEKPE